MCVLSDEGAEDTRRKLARYNNIIIITGNNSPRAEAVNSNTCLPDGLSVF